MPIYDQHRLIFIHIPKCAGTSINNLYCPELEKAYGNPNKFSIKYMFGRELQHLTARKVALLAPVRFKTYYKFSIARNPYDRVVSEFRWRISWDEKLQGFSIDDFVCQIPDHINQGHLRPQVEFLYSRSGRLLVDHICRFEDLEKGIKKVNCNANIRLGNTLPHANKSVKKGFLLSKQLRRKIADIYRDDFKLLGYEL
ncbi:MULTISPECIES: sulfotransferase family 2 domain-containing protein [unclassified Alteromonas]|uniref:sulfotransferase family 2 domain-containing protein n=1 Tax=unclassified Alteromonas TaxID=2614992 RepID=UPI000509E40E|nr:MULTISPECIES: sulfotransferase family 2 domain-containing protein [unclassified Alteromonas]